MYTNFSLHQFYLPDLNLKLLRFYNTGEKNCLTSFHYEEVTSIYNNKSSESIIVKDNFLKSTKNRLLCNSKYFKSKKEKGISSNGIRFISFHIHMSICCQSFTFFLFRCTVSIYQSSNSFFIILCNCSLIHFPLWSLLLE